MIEWVQFDGISAELGNGGLGFHFVFFKEESFHFTFATNEFHCHFDWMLFTPLHVHITSVAPGLPPWCPIFKSL